MRISAVAASVLCSFSLFAQEPGESRDVSTPKEAWVRFEAEQASVGGQWRAQWTRATGTPSAIWGTGLKLPNWTENTLEAARQHAERLLAEHRELLGLGTSTFQEIIGARMGRSWSFTFDQFFRGVPVIEGRADVRINRNGTVAMFGSRAFPIPADFNTTPSIAPEVADAIAWTALGAPRSDAPQPGQPRTTRLVIWGDITASNLAPVFLAWEVPISNIDKSGNGAIGRYYVDATTGRVLHYENDLHQCSAACTHAPTAAPAAAAALPVLTTVTLTGWTRTGNDAFSALVNTPLPRFVVNVPGIGNVVTDANGQFTIDIAAPVNIAITSLDGTHFSPVQGAAAPAGNFVVNPGVNTTIQLLTAAATTDEAAHTTVGYWVDRTNEWARSILGNSAQLNTADAITPTVNIAQNCNAFYSGNTINFYTAGGGCANTAFSTVVSHEWGHGLDERYGGISNATGDGLSEGWGDICGMYLVDSNLLGSGFNTAGVPLRNGINARTYPQTGQAVHTAGQVWMGFAWELRTRLKQVMPAQQAIDLSNDIVLSSIVADATNQVDAVREVFIADDDDGNLLNGTPNYTQLSGAATAKALPFPEMEFASIAHIALTNTTERLVPRLVNANVVPLQGSITLARVVFNAGSGNISRIMQPTGALFGYRALLPGLMSGSVSYHIEAAHSSGVVVRFPETGEITYNVDASAGQPFTPFYTETFEAGAAGWTSTLVTGPSNDWQLGDPNGRSGTSGGIAWADPQTAGGGVNCYGTDLGNTIGTTNWNGQYATNVESYLRSPVINCTGRFGVRLRFKRWLTIEAGQFDQAIVRVNGQQVWANPTTTNLVDTSWVTVEYLLPMADNNPAVQVEWYLNTDGGVNLGGWNIDDVVLGTNAAPPALGAELRQLPEQCVQGAPVTFSVQTQGPNLPWFVLLGDTPGPLAIPDLPVINVGGALIIVSGWTDATGNSTIVYPAPSVAATAGTLTYSQVLTIDGALTGWVVSNQFVNLFTIN